MYNEKVKAAMDELSELTDAYTRLVDSDEYQLAKLVAPFELANAKHVCEMLALVKESDASLQMSFQTSQEAAQLFAQVVGTKNKLTYLLDEASLLVEVADLSDKINMLVSSNPYLSSSFGVLKSGSTESIARECLEILPNYPELLTRKFKVSFVESCLESLDMKNISELISIKLISPIDLDHIKLVGSDSSSDRYETNLKHVCELFGRGVKVLELENQHLKGVSFKNEDGTDRQKIISELKHDHLTGEQIVLDVEETTYTPKDGPTEPAVEINYKGNRIGFLSADLVKKVYEEFESPNFAVTLEEVTGQTAPGKCYGCDVTVKVTAFGLTKNNQKNMDLSSQEVVSAEDIPVDVC